MTKKVTFDMPCQGARELPLMTICCVLCHPVLRMCVDWWRASVRKVCSCTLLSGMQVRQYLLLSMYWVYDAAHLALCFSTHVCHLHSVALASYSNAHPPLLAMLVV